MAKQTNNFFRMDMIILKILETHDCYGYQITQLIKKGSNDIIQISEGTLYPTLYKLLDNEYISDKKISVSKRMSRVYYHIEPKGLEYLKQLENEYIRFRDGIDAIMEGIDENLY